MNRTRSDIALLDRKGWGGHMIDLKMKGMDQLLLDRE